MGNRRKQARQIAIVGVVSALICAGLWLRLLYTQRPYFHPDEYISMVIAKTVAERGVPVLPSGLWYDPEIAFSYFSGLFVFFLGARLFVVRWASVFFGVLSIPMAYVTGRRIFSSSFAGITAATLLAVAPEAVLWGGRARRYSMGEFLILLMLLLTWLGAVEGNKRRYRIFFYAMCVVAGLTFLQALVVIPPLLLAVLVLNWRRYITIRGSILRRQSIVEVVLIALTLAGLYLRAKSNFIAPVAAVQATRHFREEGVSSFSKSVATLIPFLLPAFDLRSALLRIRGLFLPEPLYSVLAIPALLTIVLSLVPHLDKTGKFRRAIWLLLIIAGGVMFEFLFLVSEDWAGTRPRYLFVSFWPAFMLLVCGAVAGLERLARSWYPLATHPKLAEWVLVPIMLLLLTAFLAFTVPSTLGNLGNILEDEINYHQAFQFVIAHWQSGDQVTAVLPIISYWYLGKTDYYVVDRNPEIFQNSGSEMVDMKTGTRWVSSPEELDEALRHGRIWFVVDRGRLGRNFSLAFRQQLLARMEPVFEADQVYVLLPKRKATTIPTQLDTQLQARLAGQVELTGFSLDQGALLRGAPAQLTLFWKPLQRMANYKVFVHLRDRDGRIVAQADHIPSEVLFALPTSTWREGEIVPDVSYLKVPADTPAGEYRLLVGMYDPDTLERLPVEGDSSGENAVVITTLRRP